DDTNGKIVFCSSIPFLDYPLAAKISELTGIKKVHIENDANAAAKGEATVGMAKGYNSSILITLGTGVGGGFVFDGKLYTGCNFAAFEVGHIVIDPNGPDCACGRRGCWEQLASATALERMTREAMNADENSQMWEICQNDILNATARTAFIAQRKGDKSGDAVVKQYIKNLACGLVNMINILQPDIITIGGGVCNEGEYLLKPLLKIIDSEQYSRYGKKKTKIAIAALGNNAGIIGAAMLGR
ncbi:MAG: ROK family protein, partial [Clostridia bacterium]